MSIRAHNKVACALVMAGSRAAKNYDGAGRGDAWAHEAPGVLRQLESFGLSGEVTKVSDTSSPLNTGAGCCRGGCLGAS